MDIETKGIAWTFVIFWGLAFLANVAFWSFVIWAVYRLVMWVTS